MAWLSAVLIVCFTLFLGGIAYCGRNFLKSNAASFFTQLDGDGRETEDRTGFRRTIGTWNFEPEVVTVGDDGEKKSKAKAPMNLIDVVSPRGSDESAVVSEGEGDVEANSSGHGPVHVVRRVEVDSAGGKSGADKEDTPKKGFLGLFGGGSGSSKVSPTPTPRAHKTTSRTCICAGPPGSAQQSQARVW